MVGNEDGASGSVPGEGNSGEISGDSIGDDRGESGKYAGEADIVEVGSLSLDCKASEELKVMVTKTMTIAKNVHVVAIK